MANTPSSDLQSYRMDYEQSLKNNWLVVVGLSWLKEGASSIGSGKSVEVRLPDGTPENLGTFHFSKSQKGSKIEIEFSDTRNVLLDGKPVKARKRYVVQTDKAGDKRTLVESGPVRFYLIERTHGIGVRIKDANSETLRNFKGLQWWEEKSEFRITAHWQKLEQPKLIYIPDVLGESSKESLDGFVRFSYKDHNYDLYPTREGDDLFFVFKDGTSGLSSYGTGRFLNAKIEKNGDVQLDFNKAHNPPCAFISYATCPLAPKENNLPFAIEAGEKKPIRTHH